MLRRQSARGLQRLGGLARVSLTAVRHRSDFLASYEDHVSERAKLGIAPKPLDAQQTADLVQVLEAPPQDEQEQLLELLSQRVPPGVDEAAYVKAGFLAAISKGEAQSPIIDAKRAVELLGTMQASLGPSQCMAAWLSAQR